MSNHIVPLSAGFMLTSLLGGIVSAIYVYPQSAKWGFTFILFFVLMLVSSLISMTYAPIGAEFDVHHRREKRLRR